MSEYITVRGFVATDPQTRVVQAGFSVGNFRLAATDRRFDRERNTWVDGATNWFTVNMFRSLALNAGVSLEKGQPVVVTGRLKVRPWETEQRSGTSVEIDADSIGHDLVLGTASFARSNGRPGDLMGGAASMSTDPVGAVEAGAEGGEAGMRVNPATGEVLEDQSGADDAGEGGESGDEDPQAEDESEGADRMAVS